GQVARPRRALAQLRRQAALADPRFADDEQYPAAPVAEPVNQLETECQLRISAHHGRNRFRQGSAARYVLQAFDRIGNHRLRLALELQRPGLAPLEYGCHLAMGGLGNENAARIGSCLQARRGVDRVADGSVLDPAACANLADDHLAGMDARPHGELRAEAPPNLLGVLADADHQVERGPDRTLGVVLMRYRGAEDCQDTVPGKVLDRSAVRLDHPDRARNRLAYHQLDLLRVEPFSQRG